jgi:hypothetical protein
MECHLYFLVLFTFRQPAKVRRHNRNCTPCHTRQMDSVSHVSQHWLLQTVFLLFLVSHGSPSLFPSNHISDVCSSHASFSVDTEHKSRVKLYVHFCFRVGVSQNQPEHTSLATKIRRSNPNHCYVSFNVANCQNSKSRYRITKITQKLYSDIQSDNVKDKLVTYILEVLSNR